MTMNSFQSLVIKSVEMNIKSHILLVHPSKQIIFFGFKSVDEIQRHCNDNFCTKTCFKLGFITNIGIYPALNFSKIIIVINNLNFALFLLTVYKLLILNCQSL